jgi:hypothetical protein
MAAESSDERPASAARVRLVALVVLLGVGALLAVVAVVTGESEKPARAAPLRVELYPGPKGLEVVIYVPPRHNLPEVAHNRSTVRIECTDARGRVLAKAPHRWPFSDTDGGITQAHVHLPVPADKVGDVKRCRLADTEPALQGPITDVKIR